MKNVVAVACVLVFGASLEAQGQTVAAAACERLAASLSLPHATVTSAKAVAAGKFSPPGGGAAAARAAASLPAFCRVALTIKPSSDSDIKSEVWLPLSGWNGKFLQVGNGAWGGSIQYGLESATTIVWDDAAAARMKKIPAFVRGMVVTAVEESCRKSGLDRHRAYRHRCELRRRASGEAD